MTHRHEWERNLEYPENGELFYCKCGQELGWLAVGKRIDATECLSADDAEALGNGMETLKGLTQLSIYDDSEDVLEKRRKQLHDYAKTLRGEE